LEILFLSADTSVILTVSVGLHSHVIEYLTDVWAPVVRELVVRMLTVMLLITELSVLVHLTSWEIHTPDATQSVLVTMIVLVTRLVSDWSVETPAMNLTPMYVAKAPPVKPPTTRLYVHVLQDTLEILSSAVESSRKEICAPLTLVE